MAKIIPNDQMEPLAEGYLDIDHESVVSLESKYQRDPDKFKREVFREWQYKNKGQVKVSVPVLFLHYVVPRWVNSHLIYLKRKICFVLFKTCHYF